MSDYDVNGDIVEDLSRKFVEVIAEEMEERESISLADISIAQSISMTYTSEQLKEDDSQ